MFTFYVACENYRRVNNLIHDYIYQYPEEIVKVSRVKSEMVQSDGTLIRFVTLNCPEKLKGVRDDIYTEYGFREMYQIK